MLIYNIYSYKKFKYMFFNYSEIKNILKQHL